MNLLADGNGPAVLETPTVAIDPVLTATTSVSFVPSPTPEVKGNTFGSWGVWVLLALVVIVIGGYYLVKRILKKRATK